MKLHAERGTVLSKADHCLVRAVNPIITYADHHSSVSDYSFDRYPKTRLYIERNCRCY
jgi:hypothetical protein